MPTRRKRANLERPGANPSSACTWGAPGQPAPSKRRLRASTARHTHRGLGLQRDQSLSPDPRPLGRPKGAGLLREQREELAGLLLRQSGGGTLKPEEGTLGCSKDALSGIRIPLSGGGHPRVGAGFRHSDSGCRGVPVGSKLSSPSPETGCGPRLLELYRWEAWVDSR